MRKILLLFIIIFAPAIHSQEKITQAILKQCSGSDDPNECTNEKLKSIFIGLVRPNTIDDLTNNDNISVSAFFMTDADGKVIPDQTDIKCPSEKLKAAIDAYIKRLPAFYPKDEKLKERRSVHVINFTLMKNESGNYFIAERTDFMQRLIIPDYHKIDHPPLWRGCDVTGNYRADLSCTTQKLYKYIQSNFIAPKNPEQQNESLIAYFTVDTEGKIKLKKIEGGTEGFQNQVYVVLKKAPKLEPATVKGIAIPIDFSLPFNFSQK